MEIDYLECPNGGRIEYMRFGHGPALMIALHGFGDNARLFKPLEPSLSEHFVVYALSFPYHGRTVWDGSFSRADVIFWIETILRREGHERFELLGYSMGGKITLSLLPHFLPRINKLWLLASDGIKTHPLYDVTSLPRWFVRTVKFLMRDKPTTFLRIVKFCYRFGIISKFIHDFTQNHFSNDQKRERFLNISDSIHDFVPHVPEIKKLLIAQKTPCWLFFGVRDEVITMDAAFYFIEGMPFATLHQLQKGHLLVDDDLDMLFTQLINAQNTHVPVE